MKTKESRGRCLCGRSDQLLSIAVNRGQTKRSALDQMLQHALPVRFGEVVEREDLLGNVPRIKKRYLFVATIELTDLQSEAKIQERTSDLSLYGCRVETRKPFPRGAKVRIRIAYRSANFVALGRVSYATERGMGIAFTQIEPNHQLILEKWVWECRSAIRKRQDFQRYSSPATSRPVATEPVYIKSVRGAGYAFQMVVPPKKAGA